MGKVFSQVPSRFLVALREPKPNDVVAYLNKGNTLNALLRYDEAISTFDYSIQLDPYSATAYYCKGIALEQLGRRKEAQQSYAKAQQFGWHQL